MDDAHELDEATVYRLARAVFAATWRDAMGRRWPNLAGDVEALCERAHALGRARGREGDHRGRPDGFGRPGIGP